MVKEEEETGDKHMGMEEVMCTEKAICVDEEMILRFD